VFSEFNATKSGFTYKPAPKVLLSAPSLALEIWLQKPIWGDRDYWPDWQAENSFGLCWEIISN
jgi:hypothetical protein